MAGNFEGIKQRRFGVEIEITGLTRCAAAKALQKVLGGSISHVGGSYDKYTIGDDKGRKWQIVSDGSIYARKKNGQPASDLYKVEMNSPILEFDDLDQLQKVIRALREAGAITGPEYDCGTHIHIDAADYTPQQIKNLVNLWSSKEDYLWEALQVSSDRSNYCKKINRDFVKQLNTKNPRTMDKIAELWYAETYYSRDAHYNPTRYHALNLHSFFQHGHYEIRAYNASLHAGEVKAQILLALAISNAAVTKKYCSPAVSHSDNMRYSFRVFLLNLGFIGDEYKNYRAHLLKHLSGNIAWRHPEDAIAQRERLKAEREAARHENSQTQPNESEAINASSEYQSAAEGDSEVIAITM